MKRSIRLHPRTLVQDGILVGCCHILELLGSKTDYLDRDDLVSQRHELFDKGRCAMERFHRKTEVCGVP
jgi:hypothetical protein